MRYATKDDMVGMYGENVVALVADSEASGITNDTAIANGLEQASAIINGYVATVYSLPLVSTPSILKTFCIDIALYRIALTLDRATLEMRQRYEDAIRFLEGIAKGKVTLGIPAEDLGNEVPSDFTIGTISPVRG